MHARGEIRLIRVYDVLLGVLLLPQSDDSHYEIQQTQYARDKREEPLVVGHRVHVLEPKYPRVLLQLTKRNEDGAQALKRKTVLNLHAGLWAPTHRHLERRRDCPQYQHQEPAHVVNYMSVFP